MKADMEVVEEVVTVIAMVVAVVGVLAAVDGVVLMIEEVTVTGGTGEDRLVVEDSETEGDVEAAEVDMAVGHEMIMGEMASFFFERLLTFSIDFKGLDTSAF